MEHLSGKGMFIWQIAHCEDGDVDAIVGRAKQAGLTHVLIKIADGRAAYNGDPADLVLALLDAGIKPWAWQYTYAPHPADEAVFGARRFSELPFAGFVIDAEFEYKGHPQQASRTWTPCAPASRTPPSRSAHSTCPICIRSFHGTHS